MTFADYGSRDGHLRVGELGEKSCECPLAMRALRPLLAIVATLGLVTAGCGLDKVEDPPPHRAVGDRHLRAAHRAPGHAERGRGEPVDGAARAAKPGWVGLQWPGRSTSRTTGTGCSVRPASSTYVGPVQTGIVMATDRNGVANVVYVAGTGLGTVKVYVRPYSIDGASWFERTVEILQR